MGYYFRMSRKLDRKEPADFGLAMDGSRVYSPADGSEWIGCQLYDLGWGRENGFYRVPLLGFDTLLRIVLTGDDMDDVYGAAALIMECCPEELLDVCERSFQELSRDQLKRLVSVFRLDSGLNQSPILGKTFAEIGHDSLRWVTLKRRLELAIK